MNIPTASELKALTEPHEAPCITIVLSTHRTGVQADQAKLRHTIRQVERRLRERGSPATEDILEPLQELVEQDTFWKHPGDGLVIFRSPRMFRAYYVPLRMKDHVFIGEQFYLKPLLPLMVDDGRFYVLALSQNAVRLFEGTHYGIQELTLPEEVPSSLAEALRYDQPNNQLQYHSSASGATLGKGGRHPEIFHGQGVGIDDIKTDLLRFCQQINHGLHEILHDETAPLVLACVEYLFPIYKEANTYSHLLEQVIPGNPDKLSAETLRERAWAIVEPHILKPMSEAAARYNDTADTEWASNSIREVLSAARYGRVESLFVALDQEQWGRFDPATNTLILHQEEQVNDVDLLDVAATQTLLHGGKVYAVERTNVPGKSALAAVFRY